MGLSIKGITVAGRISAANVSSGASVSISPSVDGKSVWNFSTDGNLNLGTYGEWTIIPNSDITTTTKMWGAGGAQGFAYSQSYLTGNTSQGAGGSGGYSTATITLKSGVSYILRVGQGGARVNTISSATYLAGGVNSTNYGGAQAGGYTGIFKNSASQANALLMAGGGGGGGDSVYSSPTAAGGGGGGTIGQASNDGAGGGGQGGRGGTQSAGGIPSVYNSATAGSALTGGRGAAGIGGASLGGGGSGYYGGGGGNVSGGGGGSGYVSSNTDVVSGSTTAANYNTPANSGDSERNNAAQGGNSTIGNTATNGRLIIKLP